MLLLNIKWGIHKKSLIHFQSHQLQSDFPFFPRDFLFLIFCVSPTPSPESPSLIPSSCIYIYMKK